MKMIIGLCLCFLLVGCGDKVSVDTQTKNEQVIVTAKAGDVLVCAHEDDNKKETFSVFVFSQNVVSGTTTVVSGYWVERSNLKRISEIPSEAISKSCSRVHIPTTQSAADRAVGSILMRGTLY